MAEKQRSGQDYIAPEKMSEILYHVMDKARAHQRKPSNDSR